MHQSNVFCLQRPGWLLAFCVVLPSCVAEELSADQPKLNEAGRSVVIIVDNGESMTLPSGAVSRHDVAVSLVKDVVEACPDEASIIMVSMRDGSQFSKRFPALDDEHRKSVVQTIRSLTPSGKASLSSCLRCEDVPWQTYQSKPTTFVVIGDGEQCGMDDPAVIRLARQQFGAQHKLLVLGTCQNLTARSVLSEFAIACGGLCTHCDSTKSLHKQISQLIALFNNQRDEHGDGILQIVFSLQRQQAEQYMTLVEKLEQLKGAHRVSTVLMTHQVENIRSDLVRIHDELTSESQKLESMRQLNLQLENRVATTTQVKELQRELKAALTANADSLTMITERLERLATRDDVNLIRTDIAEIRSGTSSDDTASLQAISKQLQLLSDAASEKQSLGQFHLLWFLPLLVGLTAGVLLLFAWLLKRLFFIGQDHQGCAAASTPAAHCQVALNAAEARLSEVVRDQGCRQISHLGTCPFVQSQAPEKPLPPVPLPSDEPLDIEAVSAAADVGSPKRRKQTKATVRPQNLLDDDTKVLTRLIGGDHRIATELFGRGIDSVFSLGRIPDTEIPVLADQLPGVSERMLRNWVKTARSK